MGAPTYRFVCDVCGDEEIMLYRPPPADRHVCGSCEQAEFASGVERQRRRHLWPILALALFVAVLALGYFAFAASEHRPARDPVVQ